MNCPGYETEKIFSDAGAKACVSFQINDRSPKRKTEIWEVWRLQDGSHIGQARWYSAARKYCFFPSHGTALDPDCLASIAEFIESETVKHCKGQTRILGAVGGLIRARDPARAQTGEVFENG